MTLWDFDEYRFDTMYEARMETDAPYDNASKDAIRSFVETNMEDEIAELQEESPYMTHAQIIDWIIAHCEEDVAERYNEQWDAEYGRDWYDD